MPQTILWLTHARLFNFCIGSSIIIKAPSTSVSYVGFASISLCYHDIPLADDSPVLIFEKHPLFLISWTNIIVNLN